jgi:hypothetical protein
MNGSDNVVGDRCSRTGRLVVTALVATFTIVLALGSSLALAQTDAPPPGSIARVANTNGQRLNVRSGPSIDQPIVARLAPDETFTVTAVAQVVGTMRWLPVRTASNQTGWVAAEFVSVVSTPMPTVARAADPTSTPAPSRPSGSERRESDERNAKPVQVEAKLKYPEVKGRDQEITVWVTRDGAPVPGAIVTVESNDGGDDERFRQLDPTNEAGRTRRVFDVRHESGTVELQVEAVAPDGGEGRTIVSYFRR